jgi:hypothetical protein
MKSKYITVQLKKEENKYLNYIGSLIKKSLE